MSTFRTAANVIRAFPQVVEQVRNTVTPLEVELGVIAAINWELNKLDSDDRVVEAIRYLMKQRGFTINDLKEE